MTIHNNRDTPVRRSDNRMAWVMGAIALLLVGGFIFFMAKDDTMTASKENRSTISSPATSTGSGNSPATTTGSGSSSIRPMQPVQPTNPAGNVPTTTPSGSPAR